jgi:Ion channel
VSIVAAVIGIAILIIVLGDAFETIVLPRRVTRRIRLARLFYRCTWLPWSALARSAATGKRQEALLSFYGPLSLLLLLILWATGLVVGFGLLHWASGSAIKTPEGTASLSTYLYLSGTSFFTLGLGDVIPTTSLGRGLIAFEAGMGFGFLALVIGYLPVLNQSFSRRELNISLLDARAGSPPTAAEMLRRHSHARGIEDLREYLQEWEIWSGELLESHLSYPVLAYYRSHHDNQSWLGALTAILDTCAFVIAEMEGPSLRQAELTFAITRHAVVDLALIFNCAPTEPEQDRLSTQELAGLRANLAETGLKLREPGAGGQRLSELRHMYEPYVHSLSRYLCVTIPPWIPGSGRRDNWQMSGWGWDSCFQIDGPSDQGKDDHF